MGRLHIVHRQIVNLLDVNSGRYMMKNFSWILFEKVGITFINFIALIVMSRLVSPSDYGIYGIMTLFIAVTETLIDSGFGGALVQKKSIIQADLDTLFMFNIFISLISYIILCLTSPIIENFYQIKNLSLYFRVIGLTLLFYALSVVQVSLYNRNLEFKKSALVNTASYLIAAIIGILLAYYGLGIWALIIQLLLSSFFLAVFYWIFNPIKIGKRFSYSSFTSLWKFGVSTVGANILQTVVNNLTTSIIPKIGTSDQSGLFLQANRVSNLPTSILSQCVDKGVFPILSKEVNDQNVIASARRLNRLFLSLIVPLFPIISLLSFPLVMILLGNDWLGSVQYLSILSWSGIALTIQSVYRNIVKSTGKTQFILIAEICKSLIILVVVFISIRFGVLFLVYAVTLASYLGVLVWACVLKWKFQYLFRSQLSDVAKPVSAMLLMVCLIRICNIDLDNYISLVIAPIAYVLYWIISIFLFKNRELIEITRKMFSTLSKQRR